MTDDGADRALPQPGPGGFDTWDLVRHYRFPDELDGSGVSVGLVRLYGGFRRSDIQQYFAAAGRSAPVIEEVSFSGQANNPVADPPANTQLVRDLEILGTAAPGARINVYFADNTEMGIVDGFSQAIHDSGRDNWVICFTGEIPEAEVTPMLAHTVADFVQDAAAMGKVVCAPAGSWTAGGLMPYFPGTSPYMLSCAATRAVAVGNDLVERPVPAVQPVVGGPAGREITGRLVPDVTCLADDNHGYRCYINGTWGSVAGVGSAVCMWAGLLARILQATGRPALMLPDLYQRLGPAGALTQTDPASARGKWSPGTGWGSPDGQRLLAALATKSRRSR
jgi:kumamolisin